MKRSELAYLTREEALEQVAPSRFALVAALLALGLLAAAIFWASRVEITSVATAPGEVIPTGDERVVQHLEGGIVREVRFRDGDLVSRGDIVIAFDPTLRQAELDQIRARDAALTIRERRLRAFIDGGEPGYDEFAEEYPELVAEAQFNLASAREQLLGQVAVLESQIAQQRRTVGIFNDQVSTLVNQEKLVAEAAEMRRTLFERGHGSRVNVISAQLELSAVQGSIMEARSSAEQAKVAIEETQNEIRQVQLTERGAAMEELSLTLAERAEVRENLERLSDRVARLSVRAPVDGVVHRLQINTPGAVVEPAEVLMTIVPLEEEVVIEARIQPKDIGHLEIGQPARVTVSGFDARRYGVLPGRLAQISPTTYTDETGQTYFKGRVLLDQKTIQSDGVRHPIVPGMTVQADIAIGGQSFLQYLTSPVYLALNRAFSER
ncbi:MAG: HlyD family type I secretion periplasmic adaptor subunit [Alphaproteobacteria bacterium]|nr:HlyD family type I secretion periplasmic adaptor subunit [Alphaproteobacteria bacterium]